MRMNPEWLTLTMIALGRETLAGQTLGIVGLGRTGHQAAAVGRALGMRVMAATRTPSKAYPDTDYVDDVVDMYWLEAVLRTADFVVLCLPLDESTRGIFGAA